MAVTWPQHHVQEVALRRHSSILLLLLLTLLVRSLQPWHGAHGQLLVDPDAALSMQACLAQAVNRTCSNGSLVNKTLPAKIQGIVQLLNGCNITSPAPHIRTAPALGVQLIPWSDGLQQWLNPLLEAYRQISGINVAIESPDASTYLAALESSIRNASDTDLTHDAWLTVASAAGTGVADGAFLALDTLVQQDASLQLSTLLPALTSAAAVWGNQMVALPQTTLVPYLYYRLDIFQAHGWQLPNTWKGLLALAQRINGTQGMWAFGASWRCGQLGSSLFRSMFASHTQTNGIEEGWLIDPSTMQPMLDSPALTEILRVLQQLSQLSAPDLSLQHPQPCSTQSHSFVQGKALMTISLPGVFKYVAHESRASAVGRLQGNLGVSPLPGAQQVLDRDNNVLRDCIWQICPYAERRVEDGVSMLVNYAPSFGGGMWYINQLTPLDTQQAAYRLASYMAAPPTMDRLTYHRDVEVYGARNNHLRPYTWSANGFNVSDAKQFCAAQEWTVQHPNLQFQIRIPGAQHFIQMQEELVAVAINSSVPLSEADLTALRKSSQARAEQILSDAFDGDLTKAGTQYRDSIQYAAALGKGGSSNNSVSKPSKHSTLVISLCVVLPVLLSAIAIFFVSRSLNQAASGNTKHPGPGPQTTILITDIENSTTLWENIRADVLDASMKLHNKCIRRAAMKCQGYESAWEGDSFILAFPTPLAAVQCAMMVQQDLLHLDWSPTLLDSIYACPIWLQPLKPNLFLQDDDGGWRIKQRGLTTVKLPGTNGSPAASGGLASVPASAVPPHLPTQSKSGKRERPTTPQRPGTPRGTSFVDANGISDCMIDEKVLRDDVLFDALNRSASAGDSIEPAVDPDRVGAAEADAASLAENGSVIIPMGADSANGFSGLLDSGSDTEELTINSRAASELPGGPPGSAATYSHIWRTTWAISDEDGLGAILAYRGLRVRVGMYSGVNSEADINFNSTMGRYHYTGPVRIIANAIASAGHGGQTIASNRVLQSALKGGTDAGVSSDGRELTGWMPSEATWFNMGRHQLEGVDDESIDLVCVLPKSLVCRMAIVQHHTLRKTRCLVPGCMKAPIPGQIFLVGLQIQGLGTLFSWNEHETRTALMTALLCAMEAAAQWGAVVSENGWAVSIATGKAQALGGTSSSGLPACLLAVFTSPKAALGWALHVRNALLLQDWSQAILSHSMCEQAGEGLTREILDQLHQPPIWHELDSQPAVVPSEASIRPPLGPFHTASQSGFPISTPLIGTSSSVNVMSGPLYPLSSSLPHPANQPYVPSSLQVPPSSAYASPINLSPGSRAPSQPLPPTATCIRTTEPGFTSARDSHASQGFSAELPSGIGRGRGDPFTRLTGHGREPSTSTPGYRTRPDAAQAVSSSAIPSPRGSGGLASPTLPQLAGQGCLVHSNDMAYSLQESSGPTNSINPNLMAALLKVDGSVHSPGSPRALRNTPGPSPPRSQQRSETALSSRQLFGSGTPSQLFGKSKGSIAPARMQENGHEHDKGLTHNKQTKKVLFNDAPVLRGMRVCVAVVRGGRCTASMGLLGRLLYNGACMKRMQRLLRMAKSGQVVTTADVLHLSRREHPHSCY